MTLVDDYGLHDEMTMVVKMILMMVLMTLIITITFPS